MLMKQLLQKLTFSLLLVSAVTFTASAQATERGNATIDAGLVIHLDETEPLVADYSFSISTIAFKDEAAAVRFFGLCRDNIVSYTLDWAAKTATVHIALEYMEPRGWDIVKYNEYFSKLSERYRTTLSVVNE